MKIIPFALLSLVGIIAAKSFFAARKKTKAVSEPEIPKPTISITEVCPNCFAEAMAFVEWVVERYPSCILTVPDVRFVVSVASYLHKNELAKIMYLHGHRMLLALMEYATFNEIYESAGIIRGVIESHNKVMNDNIPLSLSEALKED